MSASNLQSRATSRGAPAEVTGWVGWVAFAAFMLMIGGILTVVMGALAVINNNWTVWNNNGVPFGDAYWWGWWSIFVGLVVISIGGALLRGSMFARTVAVFVAAGSLISHFAALNVAPLWSLTVIFIDILVIWAVMVHGREMKGV
jgi:predicted signal transduction protein with EAL and GGDEF domain